MCVMRCCLLAVGCRLQDGSSNNTRVLHGSIGDACQPGSNVHGQQMVRVYCCFMPCVAALTTPIHSSCMLFCTLRALCQVASPPHPEELNKEALFLCKGDIFAGETKQAREPTSTMVRPGVVTNQIYCWKVRTDSRDKKHCLLYSRLNPCTCSSTCLLAWLVYNGRVQAQLRVAAVLWTCCCSYSACQLADTRTPCRYVTCKSTSQLQSSCCPPNHSACAFHACDPCPAG